MRSFIIGTLRKYSHNDEVKEDSIGRACSTHGEKRDAWFWWESQKERRMWEDNIKINFKELRRGGTD
jgi:hypothetical protein